MEIIKTIIRKTFTTSWLWLLLLASSMSHAVTYFEQCDSALKKPSFNLLAQYLSQHNGLLDQDDVNSVPDICFQLSNHTFLVIAGYVPLGGDPNDGMYFCDFDNHEDNRQTRKQQCTEQDATLYQPHVLKEFNDVRGKHFVLFSAVGVPSGTVSQEYAIFYLTTPSTVTNGLPFVMQSLFETEYQQDDEPARSLAQLCKPHAGYKNKIDFTNDKYTTDPDEMGDADIKFTHAEKDCRTKKLSWHTREFVFKQGTFNEVKAGSVKIKKLIPTAS